MRAAWFSRFGSAQEVLQLGEVEKPEPGIGEVLVRLSTSGVNPSDVKKRAGSFPNLLDTGFVIPNSDGAGVVESVGEGVSKDRIGERVWVYQAQYGRRFGTAAEYVTLESNRAVYLPENTSFDIGACLGIPAMTAHRAVFSDGDVSGQTLLITGGAGRVGFYAIQWAVQSGARVIATASNPDDVAACKGVGAECIVNHRDPDWPSLVAEFTNDEPIDRIIDVELGANLANAVMLIKIGGVIATYSSTQISEPKLPFYEMMYKDLTLRFIIVYAMPETAKDQAIKDIDIALGNKSLIHRVSHQLPLSEIVKANELIETGGFAGSVVLNIH